MTPGAGLAPVWATSVRMPILPLRRPSTTPVSKLSSWKAEPFGSRERLLLQDAPKCGIKPILGQDAVGTDMETLATQTREEAGSEVDPTRRPSATSAAHKALIARNLRLAYQEVAKE